MAASDIRPYWFMVAGFVLLYLFALMFYRPNRHPRGILPGETQHMLYEGFSASHTFYMFGADWCGYCKKAKPEFEKLGTTMTIGGKEVAVSYVDAQANQKMAQEYGVEGYPTFVLETDGKKIKYDDPNRLADSFRAFLQKHLA
jgi:thiol-disulfide isomerase/thioredoxin